MRQIILFTLAALVTVVGFVLLVATDVQGDREEFRTQCDNQGGRLIELNHRLICRMGDITIEYGED